MEAARLIQQADFDRWKANKQEPFADTKCLAGLRQRIDQLNSELINFGVSLSFYFEDPEGHLIEVYWPTGVPCRPRHGDPIDLTHAEEALRREVAELAAG
jgi:catechol-2,3-dioxygenase